jgi:ribosomal protein S18 acetylase RimI-like enzyme
MLVEVRASPDETVLAGYAYLAWSRPPAVVTGPTPLELKRVYIDTPWHGRGLAQTLMADVLRRATEYGAKTMWLSVWEHNFRAQAFYKKYGFSRVGEHVFPVGTDPQVDWLLEKPMISVSG